MNAILEQVKPETAALIGQLAHARRLSIDELLRSLLPAAESLKSEERPLHETATPEELAQALLAWAHGHDRNSPGLTLADVSRESIYEDR
ncbi:MAG: hypothetical protein ACREEM_44385 [Blastocatellia bacterium]